MLERPSKSLFLRSLPLLLLLLAPRSTQATTVSAPANLGELARVSETVVFAQAIESYGEEGDTLPYTVTRFQLLRQVAGREVSAVFETREPGGTAAGTAGMSQGAVVVGSPRFEPGHNYLLFLDEAGASSGGRWRSKTLAYGLLEETPDGQRLRPLPQADRIEVLPGRAIEPIAVYKKEALLQHLGEVKKGARWDRQRVVAASLDVSNKSEESAAPSGITSVSAASHTAPPDCEFLPDAGDGLPLRWFGFETGSRTATIVATTPGQEGIPDGGAGAVAAGANAWTNHPDSVIRLEFDGTRARSVTCSANFDVDQGAVIFNDPCDDLADLSSCVGTLAFGGAFYNNTQTQNYDGEPWHPATSTFVVVNDGAQCIGEVNFRETLAHELGHSLGFGHHTPANPANALMSSMLKKDGRGASLAVTDKACASYLYHTFLDVPFSSPFWSHIEAIENAGVTGGCGSGNFCPNNTVTRDQMAVFLLTAKEGSGFTPPACTSARFTDVPCSNPFSAWINELANRGVTGGCSPGKYCPGNPVTREQMAVFLLSTLEGPGYSPPPCTTQRFSDVPCSSPFAAWINELANRGVTGGCGGSAFCPTALVTRGQMAVFLSGTFSLPRP